MAITKRFEIMKKLYTSKTFLEMAGGRMDTPHPTPIDPGARQFDADDLTRTNLTRGQLDAKMTRCETCVMGTAG